MKKYTGAKSNAGQLAKKRKRPESGRIKAHQALSPREVELMRDMYENDFWAVADLAKKFGVSEARADSLVKYKTHR